MNPGINAVRIVSGTPYAICKHGQKRLSQYMFSVDAQAVLTSFHAGFPLIPRLP